MNTELRKIKTFVVISIDQFISLGVINKLAQFICQICDSEFKRYNKNAKYCSLKCCAANKKNRVVLIPLFLSAQYTNLVPILEFIER
jgi:hypothetical protein